MLLKFPFQLEIKTNFLSDYKSLVGHQKPIMATKSNLKMELQSLQSAKHHV